MSTTVAAWDIAAARSKFPGLQQLVHGRPLAYLDNAATTQKPQSVLDATEKLYRDDTANVHRGVHTLSQRATDAFEAVRLQLAAFIGAPDARSVIWTKGCTEAINLVAQTWGMTHLQAGDVVLLSSLEHHANIVPWQMVAERTGARVIPIPMEDSCAMDLGALESLLRDHSVKLVGVKQICNATGTRHPIREITAMAKSYGARVLVDGAQGLAHGPLNVSEIDVDFYTMSAHKAYGPTGVGALYGNFELLNSLPPYQGGGDMIRTVSWEKTTYNELPNRLEPGTPNIAGVVGFGAALTEMEAWGIRNPNSAVHAHEHALLESATELLQAIPGLKIHGTAPGKAAVVSFTIEAAHPHDIGTILDRHGVAVRTGHHCCMPLMKRLGVPATARASFAAYSSHAEIEQLATALHEVRRIFS